MSEEKVLTKEIAEQFLANNGSVDLSEFTEIKDAAAESLSNFRGYIYLNGLTELSDAAAESLSNFQGDLYLNGLTELSDAAAESLSKFQGGYLGLEGLTAVSDAIIILLKPLNGINLDHVTNITPKQISLLGGEFRELLSLGGLTKLTKEHAWALTELYGEELHLMGITEIDDEIAEILVDVKPSLNISGLSTLSPRGARAIASRWRDRGEPFSSVDTADFTIEHWKQMYYGAKQGIEDFKSEVDWPSEYDENYYGPNE